MIWVSLLFFYFLVVSFIDWFGWCHVFFFFYILVSFSTASVFFLMGDGGDEYALIGLDKGWNEASMNERDGYMCGLDWLVGKAYM